MNPLQLREATAADHDRTEAAVPLMAAGLTGAEYAEALVRMYGFVRGWEVWAQAHCPVPVRPLLAERQRSALIAQDLAVLGCAVPREIALLPAEPATPAAFMGRMYVVEGSTLGGQHIAAHVAKRFGFEHGKGNAYFTGYGPRTGSMWNQFKALLLEVPDAEAGEVISAAKQMFAAFEGWMLRAGEHPGQAHPESRQEFHA